MGHKIGKPENPKRGSQGRNPRVRAKSANPRMKTWPSSNEAKLLGFAAYKAGMSHVTYVDPIKNSPSKGMVISVPVTILDAPKIKIQALRLYTKDKRRQKVCSLEITTDKPHKDLKRRLTAPKKTKSLDEQFKEAEKIMSDLVDVKVVAHTIPNGAAGGKKTPDIFEIAIGGKPSEQFEFAKKILGTELSAKDVIKAGELVDTLAVSKGKGFQGVVQRFGVKLQPRNKSDRSRRMVASIGPDKPRKVIWRIGMPGQMGFHNRQDFNKWVLKIGEHGSDVNPISGFQNYGLVRNEYIILKGSVPGADKRLIKLRLAQRPIKSMPKQAPEILSVNRVKK